MGYIDIGDVRFEHGFTVLCDCRRQADAPMTGARVVLKLTGPKESPSAAVERVSGVLEGACRVCGTQYRLTGVVMFERSPEYEAGREALNIAAATP